MSVLILVNFKELGFNMNILLENLLDRKHWTDALDCNILIKLNDTVLNESYEEDVDLVRKFHKDGSSVADTLYQIFMFGEDKAIKSEEDLFSRISSFVKIIGEEDKKEYFVRLIFKDDERLLGKGNYSRGVIFGDGSSLYIRFSQNNENGRKNDPIFFFKPGIGEENIKNGAIKDISDYKRRMNISV